MKILNKNKEKYIQSACLLWYKKNKRNLPWRKLQNNSLPNPYYILVSEFMLQQTTVNSVVKRFNEFVDIWPSSKDLSKITENRILKFWSGLGYYSRAKNLLKTIKTISRDHKSKIPNDYNELIKLPGVGDYTAKAILGIAYNKPVLPLDVNIKRIIVRLYGIKKSIQSSKKEIELIASKFESLSQASDLIQSFMDYGSSICLPRNPRCDLCKIIKFCESKKNNIQNFLPYKEKIKKKKIKFTRAYIVENNQGKILVRRRKSKGMLASMLEIPNDNWAEKKNLLERDPLYKEMCRKFIYKGNFTYSFSHFDLEISVYKAFIDKKDYQDYKLIKLNKIDSSGMPTVMKQIVEKGYY